LSILNRIHCPKAGGPKLSIHDSIGLVRTEDWNAVLSIQNIYLSIPYLKSVEEAVTSNEYRYILFYNSKQEAVGIGVFQLHTYTGEDVDIQDFIGRFGEKIRSRILDGLDIKVLLCGSAFNTGVNGFYFNEGVSIKDQFEHLNRAFDRVQREEIKQDKRLSFILFKDFPMAFENHQDVLTENGYTGFAVDKNMVISVHPAWVNFDAYMADMTTKFRTKIKGVLKKSNELVVKSLDYGEILQYEEQINALYLSVMERANYRFGVINARAFSNMKKNLGDNYVFNAYLLDNQLVSFGTLTYNGQLADANFVGINYDLNNERALYQRILIDFIRDAIDRKSEKIQLGRTAEEVKSCLGAVPVELKLFVKHRNQLTNKIIKPFISTVQPSAYELRKPFKAAFYEAWIQ
jgi:hypothetical protein